MGRDSGWTSTEASIHRAVKAYTKHIAKSKERVAADGHGRGPEPDALDPP